MNRSHFLIYTLGIVVFTTFFFPANIYSQSRDYLTTEEIELVRDAQSIDQRVEVLIKATERRFFVLNKDDAQTKQVGKDKDKWGDLPSGTETELLTDIESILQKAIDDINDLVSNRKMNDKLYKEGNDESDVDKEVTRVKMERNEKTFPIAVHNLADASRRFIPMLESLMPIIEDRRGKGAIYGAIENCNMIIEASSQVPKYTKKSKKKKDKN